MAAEMTPAADRSVVNGNFDLHLVEVAKVTQNDWIEVSYPVLSMYGSDSTGADEALVYLATTITEALTDTTGTAVVVAAATNFPTSGDPMYIKVDSEIMEVASWDTLTLVVRRGAMGTTAATHSDDAPCYVMNVLTLAGSNTGYMSCVLASRAVS